MEKGVITFDKEKAFPIAKERFITTCGFDLGKAKHQKMMGMGQKVLDDGIDGINMQGKVTFISGEAFRDHKIIIDGEEIFCNFFEQIPDDAVEGLYFYVVTAGECYFSSEENIMDFLYADIWGTSYVDAATELLKEKIREEIKERLKENGESGSQSQGKGQGKGKGKTLNLSVEFGPGYFGMPVIETKKFVKLVGGEDIGVWTKDSGLMIPQKSCSGVFLLLNREIEFEPDCMKCNGNSKGCQFCRVRQ